MFTGRWRGVMLALIVLLGLAGCGANVAAVPSGSRPQPTAVKAGGEGGGEGVEAALVTYADAAQGFILGYPGTWTRDTSVTSGVKFAGGDDTLTMQLVTLPAATTLQAYAEQDQAKLAAQFSAFKQVGLAPSTEVNNALVLGFEAQGTSTVTAKTYPARGDRYYIPLADGRIAVLTVVGPASRYDREGVRDIALTVKTAQ